MPPRKSARTASKAASQPPSTPPLDGLNIAISGTFPGATQAVVQNKITELGASIARAVKAETTHLVTTQADYEKVSGKVKDAAALGLPIVSLDWVEECASQSSKVAENAYQFNARDPAPAKTNGKANGKKRGASGSAAPTNVEDDEEPQPKKAKSTTRPRSKKSATRAPAKDEDIDMEDDEEEEEVKKHGPKAKGKAKGKAKAEPEDEDVGMADVDAKEAPKEKKEEVAAGQVAKSADLKVPVDEHCSLGNYTVFIDPNDSLIWDASLNQTNAGNNNNKFYKIQILTNGAQYKTWTRWGRVGERGQNTILGNGSLADAIKNFEKKFKDKSGLTWANRLDPPKTRKYVFVEKSYNDDSDSDDDDDDDDDKADAKPKKEGDDDYTPPESKLDPAIQDLMGLIFNSQYWAANMADLNYDANKLPLGKLSKTTITRGFQALKDLSHLLDNPGSSNGQTIPDLSNLYYSLIPHDFGRQRPPIISTQHLLKKEIDLLESLSDMKDAQNILKAEKTKEEMNLLDRQFAGLGLEEMTTLDRKSTEFSELSAYLTGTKGETHHVNYEVQQIFRIERQGETSRFENSEYMKMPSDRRLLWHGSRVTNFGGILSQGLRIAPPEAPVSGYMFGKGIYLADMSSKSAGYCCSYISGGTGLLMLCEAELGDPMQELTAASYDAGETAKKGGMASTWGKGRTGPLKWKDAEAVHPSLKGIKIPDPSVAPGNTNVDNVRLYYNEYIAYDISQVRLRYLFRVKM
ncbi:hypothetical protein MKZ38_006746 [Zalerion maritima]|uniref:Poly [ADP-ribose] polymerase n=1 Tax=Zalerion maritima TaxID=339359 RepID=A0AAD5RJ86_9PEZI|nr:hypothetical protein MKZ38_006746 [Zalerion maritima]